MYTNLPHDKIKKVINKLISKYMDGQIMVRDKRSGIGKDFYLDNGIKKICLISNPLSIPVRNPTHRKAWDQVF